MAARTLRTGMSLRTGMAGSAIGITGVVKIDLIPGGGNMAIGTFARPMIRWPQMTGTASQACYRMIVNHTPASRRLMAYLTR
jgi:hypothetical protein